MISSRFFAIPLVCAALLGAGSSVHGEVSPIKDFFLKRPALGDVSESLKIWSGVFSLDLAGNTKEFKLLLDVYKSGKMDAPVHVGGLGLAVPSPFNHVEWSMQIADTDFLSIKGETANSHVISVRLLGGDSASGARMAVAKSIFDLTKGAFYNYGLTPFKNAKVFCLVAGNGVTVSKGADGLEELLRANPQASVLVLSFDFK